ncbi:AEC family transporter [Motiliproteus sp. MSK22-1]|uniref:AEC family transporter n=1 Tax=Motiliproteus sp. MSK22-1 TaxID=1897630 RepID=UPI000977238A|nr:AEC family transporter [Motiliproteus sp. MSK22-1]OMH38984.1 hypothetical protein BGP75_04465 [Motiliproteus sp. MSK22-1]
MSEFNGVIAALGPVFVLVLLGYACRLIGFPGQGFWPQAERFTYYLLFPSLLVYKLSTARLSGLELPSAVAAIVCLLVVASLLVYGLGVWLKLGGPALSSFYQGSVRFNTYVGLASAVELFGEQGLLWGAVFLAVMIPLVNVCCVLVFALVAEGGNRPSLGSVIMNLAKNPLILACGIGIGLNVSGLGLPWGAEPVLALLSPVALPLGLLAVGVGLDLKVLRRGGLGLWLSCFFKLLCYPLLFVVLAKLFQLSTVATSVLLIFTLLPTAPSAYILARQLGGDAPLMAAMITLQTLLAMLTIPLILVLFGYFS